jgi:hypothetical protein
MTCVDQIAAKVSGMSKSSDSTLAIVVDERLIAYFDAFTAVQVMPGDANKGLFINLSQPSPGAGEVRLSFSCALNTHGGNAEAICLFFANRNIK